MAEDAGGGEAAAAATAAAAPTSHQPCGRRGSGEQAWGGADGPPSPGEDETGRIHGVGGTPAPFVARQQHGRGVGVVCVLCFREVGKRRGLDGGYVGFERFSAPVINACVCNGVGSKPLQAARGLAVRRIMSLKMKDAGHDGEESPDRQQFPCYRREGRNSSVSARLRLLQHA